MNKEAYAQFVKSKSVKALLDLLEEVQSGRQKNDPELVNVLYDELFSRQLTEFERRQLIGMLNANAEDSFQKRGGGSSETLEDDISKLIKAKSLEQKEERNASLKSIADLISKLSTVIVLFGLGMLYYSLINKLFLVGVITFAKTLLFALLMRAFAKLIYLFIGIEINTRKEYS